MRGKLYLVGTPIGNLSDITLRALEVLKTADIIACEDTRHTLAMLNRYEIKKPLISYYKHKEKEGTEEIKSLLEEGKNVALVTDAGMPCISDPGSVLVKELYKSGYEYTVIPGASAVICAAALAGTEKGFTFVGFLPEKNKEKEKLLDAIKDLPHTVIFYAAPHDVNAVLGTLAEKLGNREVTVIKEITKIHETIVRGRLGETEIENPKGEFVIAVEPQESVEKNVSEEEIKEELESEIKRGNDKKTAIKKVSEKLKISKNIVYKISLKI